MSNPLVYRKHRRLLNIRTDLIKKRMAVNNPVPPPPPLVIIPEVDPTQPVDEAPRSFYTHKAADVMTLKMVYSPSDLKPDHARREFAPKLVHQVFGPSEQIFGYRTLSIDIYYLANSAKCLVELRYNSIMHTTKPPYPDDIVRKLTPWLPNNFSLDKKEFRNELDREDHTRIYGEVVENFKVRNTNDNTPYIYLITRCSNTEIGFKEFHSRFECLIVWFIDAASQIDINDPNWMFLYLYEKRTRAGGAVGYYPVGYCSIYKFFHFPDKMRCRISQFFIIPSCQRSGLGTRLLKAVYRSINLFPNVMDITVEDPCIEFTYMRDILDSSLALKLQIFNYPKTKHGWQEKMYQQGNARFHFNKRQCKRIYDVIRASEIALIFDEKTRDQEGSKLHEEVRKRMEAPYMREQRAIKKKKIDPRVFEMDCIYQPAETMKSLKKTVDLYMTEVKAIASRLNIKCRQ